MVRVEIIVFHHSDGNPDRWPRAHTEQFSGYPDPLDLARLSAWTARLLPDRAETDIDVDGNLFPPGPYSPAHLAALADSPEVQPGPVARVYSPYTQTPVWPDHYVGQTRHSQTMQRALDRLQSSDLHKVLAATSWFQPLDRQTPASPVRIRGHQALRIDWTTTRPDGFRAEGPIELPPSTPHVAYRLDGTLHLRQRQFRHAEVDLFWVEVTDRPDGNGEGIESADDKRFLIHRLHQSRPVRLGRLEYFDSAWLGALILVEEWERPEPRAGATNPERD